MITLETRLLQITKINEIMKRVPRKFGNSNTLPIHVAEELVQLLYIDQEELYAEIMDLIVGIYVAREEQRFIELNNRFNKQNFNEI